VDYAIALAENYEAKLILLHMVMPVVPSSFDLPLNTGEVTSALVDAAKTQLAEIAKRAKAKNIPVASIVRVGDVDMEVLDLSKDGGVDLIVMGSHGRRGFEKWFLGSHTERLLRRVPVPMIVIGGEAVNKSAPPSVRNIMVLTDFSDGTADAIRYAFSIGQECQAKLTLMHVVNDVEVDISAKQRDPLIKGIRVKLESLIPKESRAWCDVTTRVEMGVPYTTILNALKKDKFDLVVMNVHGKSILDRALLGSTAERVVRGAGVPVLLIPPLSGVKRKKRTVVRVA
jgi:nucleotide-binding universal stress UspA family protein